MREDILRSCLGKWESTGLALFAPSVSVGLYAEINIRLSSLLVCGRSAQHFAELSPAFAVLLVTVLGLEELTAGWVLWCREVWAPSAAVLCRSKFFGELWQSWRLRLAFQIRTFFRKSEGVTNNAAGNGVADLFLPSGKLLITKKQGALRGWNCTCSDELPSLQILWCTW